MPHEKKRKISSHGWSRADKEVRASTSDRVVSTNVSVCLLETVGVADNGVDVDLCKKKLQNLLGEHEIIAKCSVAKKASLYSHKSTCFDGEALQVEGDSDRKAWKGLTCRWSDELEHYGVKDESVCEKVDSKYVTPAKSDVEMSSPESGEILERSSGGNGKRSSRYEMESHSVELEVCNDTMEIDKNAEVTGVYQLDFDCEDYDDSGNQYQEVCERRNVNMPQGCRSAFEYEKLHKISEGSYGVVYKARDKLTGDIVALKKIKIKDTRDGFPITSLREMKILRSLQHPRIVEIKEVVMDDHHGVYIVMEHMEHDLKQLLNVMKQSFSQSDVKCLMLQLLEGVKFLHDNWVLHRDLKTSNLLFNNQGELKICDFGMARQYGDPLKPYTPLVVTLWYRAPEILLGAKEYSTAIDMWSVGCIMAELLTREALFTGGSEIEQLKKIYGVLGTPNDETWPGFSNLPWSKVKFDEQPYNLLHKKFRTATFYGSPILTELGLDLLKRLLTYNPEERITAEEALNHGWFQEVPLPKSKEFMPTFPCSSRRV